MGLNLLEKTELWINNVRLERANLTRVAETAADVLGFDRDKVLVVDVRERHITLDILQKDIPLENIMGKERPLLDALSRIPGVVPEPDAHVHSNGILGVICLEGADPSGTAASVAGMVDEMRRRIAKRVIVFPTGFEVRDGLIEDTNTPYLVDAFTQAGYRAEAGRVIDDNPDDMIARLSDALSRAFGLVVTTGGVGAEDKDWSVESVLRLDSDAAAPYIVKFEKGAGRHVKDGVRLAVGMVGPSLIVALPGPNDEVRLAAGVLLDCLEKGCGKEEIASRLAAVLAEKLAAKHRHWHHE